MKLTAPAVARNTGPITEVLRDWLPATGLVLEVASGSGEHAAAFASAFPALKWQPSDPDVAALASIAEWQSEAGLANLLPPVRIDACGTDWGLARADALMSINMVHISPWEASIGLLDGAARLLGPSAPLILYGPWRVEGEPLAPSNAEFDASLRQRNPAWGLREVGAFSREAAARGLHLEEQRLMPANNRMLLFRRT